MAKVVLYHGSPNEVVKPRFGLGDNRHDYGKGFYLTENMELAKEWAVAKPEAECGFLHTFELETDNLIIFDYEKESILSWLSELMKHRQADDSKRYRVLAPKFIQKYGKETDNVNIIKGYRANASYFYIAKAFIRDEVDVDILPELMGLGSLGIQWCIKSERAFLQLSKASEVLKVNFHEFNKKYNERDAIARNRMKEVIDSDKNKLEKVFSTLIKV